MTSDPYNRPLKPRRSRARTALVLLLAFLFGTTAIACVGAAISGAIDNAKDGTPVRLAAPVATTTAAPAPAEARALEAGDIKLDVKITKRECFGSAGCLVQFKIKASVDLDVLAASDRDWTVTYEVKGVEDGPQVAELVLHPDGMYDQDGYQSGQTPSRNTKLKATVTDVEPVL